jgi:hypothetical protein
MRLSPDCVRDILLYLEDNLELSSELEFLSVSAKTISESLPYSLPEIVNTLILLHEAGFLQVSVDRAGDKIVIFDVVRLTYAGHQFLESVRPKTTWEKVVGACTKFGSFSLDFVMQVATQVAVNAIPTLI